MRLAANSGPNDTSTMSTKALFLDRDGVVNVNHGYVYQTENFDFIPGIIELCQKAQRKGYLIVIVTNQSGIARRYYSRAQFKALSKWLEQQFWQQGVRIAHTYHCPHHPKQSGAFGFTCSCRKPKPGMLFKAQQSFGIDMKRSIMVGDSLSDMACALRAGVGKAVYFSPRRTSFSPRLEAPHKKPYYRADSHHAIATLL